MATFQNTIAWNYFCRFQTSFIMTAYNKLENIISQQVSGHQKICLSAKD